MALCSLSLCWVFSVLSPPGLERPASTNFWTKTKWKCRLLYQFQALHLKKYCSRAQKLICVLVGDFCVFGVEVESEIGEKARAHFRQAAATKMYVLVKTNKQLQCQCTQQPLDTDQ